MSAAPEVCYLMDNGSLRPESTLELRRVARRLSAIVKTEVQPVSVLHSDKVDAAQLDGIRAYNFTSRVRLDLSQGVRKFYVLPLFFGPNRALTDYLPTQFKKNVSGYPDAKLLMAPPLAGREAVPDLRIAEALADRIETSIDKYELSTPAVAVVDHGSPVRSVTDVRDGVTRQLREMAGALYRAVEPSSMERRPEPEYDFNEPLLDTLLCRPPFDQGDVVVAQMFLLPGRHAGPDGDIHNICREAEYPGPHRIYRTDLLADHPLILKILEDRFNFLISPVAGS